MPTIRLMGDPTHTILALSLRGAENLSEELGNGGGLTGRGPGCR
jgi:hypothetical protein